MRDRDSGNSRGFGFVTYETPEGADAAANSGPHTIDGRTADVKRAVERGAAPPSIHNAGVPAAAQGGPSPGAPRSQPPGDHR